MVNTKGKGFMIIVKGEGGGASTLWGKETAKVIVQCNKMSFIALAFKSSIGTIFESTKSIYHLVPNSSIKY